MDPSEPHRSPKEEKKENPAQDSLSVEPSKHESVEFRILFFEMSIFSHGLTGMPSCDRSLYLYMHCYVHSEHRTVVFHR
jgi:hypothetical protein